MTYEQEAIARSAIHHIQALYNNSGDRGKVDDLLTVFAPDGVLDIGRTSYTGHAAIKGFISDVAKGATPVDLAGSRHHLTTSRIEFEGDDEAKGWTYFFVMRQGSVIQEGTYIDRYGRIDGRWLIVHRRVKMLYDIAN
ncbi:nuclear transport factor 2 family protein [Sphingobium sp.]|uniref:nuclear transport factor 2 family protein n=1 Tax=Sphingobium sp. TaxID=1912891 RepID=UPI002CDAA7AF|nr:nuclear transport factor 2 family protein [Sphingobium sp.]HUD93977.1 nuclear transport factor 2 family protein [Sphingobium sp.]